MMILGDDVEHRRVLSLNKKAIQLSNGQLRIRITWRGYWTPFCELFEVGENRIFIVGDLISFGDDYALVAV